VRPPFGPAFRRGIEHFNALDFWDAHEAWEELWLEAGSDVHQFLQGLIQIAAAYHHMKRGTFRGGVRLFDSGLAKLEAFDIAYCGVDRTAVETAARQHRAWAAQRVEAGDASSRIDVRAYPKLTVVGKTEPPRADW
jgi:predicted metal-dependent hydrolase